MSTIEQAERIEYRRARLVAVLAQNEWARGENKNITTLVFCFRDTKVDEEFRLKCRLFSGYASKRERALIAIREIDRSSNMGGRLKAAVLALPSLMPESPSVVIREEELQNVEAVRLIVAHVYQNDPTSGKPMIRKTVSRVMPFIADVHMVSTAPPLAERATEFCWTREYMDVRSSVINLVGNRCMCCGANDQGTLITVDHIKPRCDYPALALSPSNMQVLCRECNRDKGEDQTDYRTDAERAALLSLQQQMSE